MEGGAIYNQGWVMEDLAWNKGVTRGNSFATYLIPTAVDAPEIETVLLESGGGLGPYGAKGVGEPADNDICPAIINALRDAIGVSFFTTLVKPQDVLTGLRDK